MTPSQSEFAEGDAAQEPSHPQARLACPGCGAEVLLREDQIGQSVRCRECGADIEITEAALEEMDSQAVEEIAERLARLVGVGQETQQDAEYEEEGAVAAASDDLLDAFNEDETEPPVLEERDEALFADLLAPGEGAAEQAPEPPAEEVAAIEGGEPEPGPAAEPVPSTGRAAQQEGLMGEGSYVIWQGVVGLGGDWAMAARLDALRRAEEAGCEMSIALADGTQLPVPQMIAAEAAVAAFQSQSEAEWREHWTRRLLQVTTKWPEEPIKEAVIAMLMHTDTVIASLKGADVWPWAEGERDARGQPPAGQ
ncbi:MAG: zinc ribbon domain-containing protein [Planctomycetota bacterium]